MRLFIFSLLCSLAASPSSYSFETRTFNVQEARAVFARSTVLTAPEAQKLTGTQFLAKGVASGVNYFLRMHGLYADCYSSTRPYGVFRPIFSMTIPKSYHRWCEGDFLQFDDGEDLMGVNFVNYETLDGIPSLKADANLNSRSKGSSVYNVEVTNEGLVINLSSKVVDKVNSFQGRAQKITYDVCRQTTNETFLVCQRRSKAISIASGRLIIDTAKAYYALERQVLEN